MKNKNPIKRKELKDKNKMIEEQQRENKNIKNPKTEKTKKDEEISNNNKKANTVVNEIVNSIGFPIVIGIILLLKTIFFYQSTTSIQEVIDVNTF